MGLKMVHVDGATGETETNYEGKVQAAVDCLKDGDDFVCIHVEAPDEATHNGNWMKRYCPLAIWTAGWFIP